MDQLIIQPPEPGSDHDWQSDVRKIRERYKLRGKPRFLSDAQKKKQHFSHLPPDKAALLKSQATLAALELLDKHLGKALIINSRDREFRELTANEGHPLGAGESLSGYRTLVQHVQRMYRLGNILDSAYATIRWNRRSRGEEEYSPRPVHFRLKPKDFEFLGIKESDVRHMPFDLFPFIHKKMEALSAEIRKAQAATRRQVKEFKGQSEPTRKNGTKQKQRTRRFSAAFKIQTYGQG